MVVNPSEPTLNTTGIGILLLLCPSEHAPVAIHTAVASSLLLCPARGVRPLSGTRHRWLMLSPCEAGAAGGVCRAPWWGIHAPCNIWCAVPMTMGGQMPCGRCKCHVDVEAITEMVWYAGHCLPRHTIQPLIGTSDGSPRDGGSCGRRWWDRFAGTGRRRW